MKKYSLNKDSDLKKLSKSELIRLLRQTDDERKRFIESSYDGYWNWYIQDDYEYMSPRFWEIFGIDYKTKKHKPGEWQDLIHPDDLKEALKNFDLHCKSKGKHPYNQEVRYKHAKGHWCTVFCRGQVVEWDDKGQAIRMVGTHTDITDLKVAQEELKRSNEELSMMAYYAAHDIKSPICTISGQAELGKMALSNAELASSTQEKQKSHKAIEKCFNNVSTVSEHLVELIDGLLKHAQLGSGPCLKKQVKLAPIIKKATSHLSGGEKITKLKVPKNVTVFADHSSLTEVFQNIFQNSIRHAKKTRPLEIEVSVKSDKSFNTICISDNGRGIKKEYSKEIFKIFKQLPSAESSQGIGLGLAICNKIIKKHSGEIWAEGKLNHGLKVFIKLPKPI